MNVRWMLMGIYIVLCSQATLAACEFGNNYTSYPGNVQHSQTSSCNEVTYETAAPCAEGYTETDSYYYNLDWCHFYDDGSGGSGGCWPIGDAADRCCTSQSVSCEAAMYDHAYFCSCDDQTCQANAQWDTTAQACVCDAGYVENEDGVCVLQGCYTGYEGYGGCIPGGYVTPLECYNDIIFGYTCTGGQSYTYVDPAYECNGSSVCQVKADPICTVGNAGGTCTSYSGYDGTYCSDGVCCVTGSYWDGSTCVETNEECTDYNTCRATGMYCKDIGPLYGQTNWGDLIAPQVY